jgi:hypothetical protein
VLGVVGEQPLVTVTAMIEALTSDGRESLKDLLAPAVSRSKHPIVVNSFGRSGSTVLYKAVVASAVAKGPTALAERIIRGRAWRLDQHQLADGRCYKSHDYPSEHMNARARVLYIFGDPLAAIRSVIRMVERMGQDWMDEHCAHLRVPPCAPADLMKRDALEIERHLSAWLAQTRNPVAFLRYEKLWDLTKELSDFLGFPIELPAKQARAAAAGSAATDRLHEVHDGAVRMMQKLPDWSVRP